MLIDCLDTHLKVNGMTLQFIYFISRFEVFDVL